MESKFIELELETWDTIFKPQTNTLDPHASFGGVMFETYGDELEYVQAIDNHYIWTYGDGDDGGSYIWNGYSFINRIGYFISTVPWEDDVTYQIQVSPPWYYCEGCGAELIDNDNTIRDTFQDAELDKCLKCATPEELKALGLDKHEILE